MFEKYVKHDDYMGAKTRLERKSNINEVIPYQPKWKCCSVCLIYTKLDSGCALFVYMCFTSLHIRHKNQTTTWVHLCTPFASHPLPHSPALFFSVNVFMCFSEYNTINWAYLTTMYRNILVCKFRLSFRPFGGCIRIEKRNSVPSIGWKISLKTQSIHMLRAWKSNSEKRQQERRWRRRAFYINQ